MDMSQELKMSAVFDQSPDKMLLKYPHIKEVNLPSKEELILIRRLKEIKEAVKDISIDRFTDYLQAPTIVDDFSATDDKDRTEFEEKIKNTEAGNFYSKNKLRNNIIGAMGLYVQALSYRKLLSEEENILYKKFNEEYTHYREANIESKMVVLKDLDDLAKKISTRLVNTYSEIEKAA